MRGPLGGIDRFPRARLGHAPTPLDPAPGLGAALGVELWIKRDDCTGLAFGGNKVRQLEFHLGEAQARGADTVLVTGAGQSNLVRLAAAGRAGSAWTRTSSSKSASTAPAPSTALRATCCSTSCWARRCMRSPWARTRRRPTQRWSGAPGQQHDHAHSLRWQPHPPRRRHPAGARQRRAHRPPTPSRSAAPDRHDVARHRPRRPRRFRAPPATRLRPVTPRRPSVGEDWQRRNAASTATEPGGYRYAPAQVSIKPTSPVAARDSAASQASSARVLLRNHPLTEYLQCLQRKRHHPDPGRLLD